MKTGEDTIPRRTEMGPPAPPGVNVKLRHLDGKPGAVVDLSQFSGAEMDVSWLEGCRADSLELIIPPGGLLLRNVACLNSTSSLSLRSPGGVRVPWVVEMPSLRRITLDADVGDQDLQAIASLDAVQGLTLGKRFRFRHGELPVGNMLALCDLRIDNFYSGSITALMALGNLDSLEFRGGVEVESIMAVQYLPNLTRLTLPDAGIGVLSPLSKLRLRTLDVSRNRVRRLPSLTELESLTARDNYITDLDEADGGCRSLRDVDLANNLLTSLPLSRWPDVEAVDASGNLLTGLDEIHAAVRLRRLDLSDNCLTRLPDLTGLTALRSLNVARNQLTVVEASRLPPGLEELNLSDTRVDDTTLSSLAQRPSLRRVDVTRTDSTHDGVRELRDALPHCSVSAAG